MNQTPTKGSVIMIIYEAIINEIGDPDFEDADFDACGSAAISLVGSLDTKFVYVPLNELTLDRVFSVKLDQYSNDIFNYDNKLDYGIKLDFDDFPLIDSFLKLYIDNRLGRYHKHSMYKPEDRLFSPDSTIAELGATVYTKLRPK